MSEPEKIEFSSPFGKIKLTPENHQKWILYMGIFGGVWLMLYNWAFILLVKNIYRYFA